MALPGRPDSFTLEEGDQPKTASSRASFSAGNGPMARRSFGMVDGQPIPHGAQTFKLENSRIDKNIADLKNFLLRLQRLNLLGSVEVVAEGDNKIKIEIYGQYKKTATLDLNKDYTLESLKEDLRSLMLTDLEVHILSREKNSLSKEELDVLSKTNGLLKEEIDALATEIALAAETRPNLSIWESTKLIFSSLYYGNSFIHINNPDDPNPVFHRRNRNAWLLTGIGLLAGGALFGLWGAAAGAIATAVLGGVAVAAVFGTITVAAVVLWGAAKGFFSCEDMTESIREVAEGVAETFANWAGNRLKFIEMIDEKKNKITSKIALVGGIKLNLIDGEREKEVTKEKVLSEWGL